MAKQVTPEEEAKIIELYNQGMNMTTIAKLLGRSECTVSRRITAAREQGLLIERPKVENPLKRDREYTPACCKGCVHRKRLHSSSPDTGCFYANDMADIGRPGEPREVRIEDCTHYERPKRKRRRSA